MYFIQKILELIPSAEGEDDSEDISIQSKTSSQGLRKKTSILFSYFGRVYFMNRTSLLNLKLIGVFLKPEACTDFQGILSWNGNIF